MTDKPPVSKAVRLSPRETEVLMWTACGKTSGAIAGYLNVSEETIRAHIKGACRKLQAANKTHATAIALVHGLIRATPSPERVISLFTLFGLSEPVPELKIAPRHGRRLIASVCLRKPRRLLTTMT
jgi:DNA-binding CsgD family transcriptional regulator